MTKCPSTALGSNAGAYKGLITLFSSWNDCDFGSLLCRSQAALHHIRYIMIRRNALALSSGCVIDPETLFVLSRGLWSSANERSRIKVPGAQ